MADLSPYLTRSPDPPPDFRLTAERLRERLPETLCELLGKPTFRSSHEWRWGQHGSLSVVMSGAKTGYWFDHERGEGGGALDLLARELGLDRAGARSWAADRLGFNSSQAGRIEGPKAHVDCANGLSSGPASEPAPSPSAREAQAGRGRRAAEAIWETARPAPPDHPYLVRKQVEPHELRCDDAGFLIVPLRDLDGALRTIERIAPDGGKRYLAGGAKAGHFCPIGPLPDSAPSLLICEGWATGASLHEATGLPVVAAMDAGNLGQVAAAVRGRFPQACIVIVADNDEKPGRNVNPGLLAARKAAEAIDARLAVLPAPGDANDLAITHGLEAVAQMVRAAAPLAPEPPTYPAPTLTVDEARDRLAEAIRGFMDEVRDYWPLVEQAEERNSEPYSFFDFNFPMIVVAPLLGLPVDVGLGKSAAARHAIASVLTSRALGGRKVVYGVPRHDLGAEQVAAFRSLGVAAMLWKGRSAPDPTAKNPDRLMCLDIEATHDALDAEMSVERSCCKAQTGDGALFCPFYEECGYQAQKFRAKSAQVIVCAHDSLFHMKPDVLGEIGLLVIDEAFWQSGLRGLEGKTFLTQDGLEPEKASVSCYGKKGKLCLEKTADLIASRLKLCKALQATVAGELRHGLLVSVGLTAEECRQAASLERSRLIDPGLRPGMTPETRRRLISKVRPPYGEPWAPPGRCAVMWLILAQALENGHDAAGAVLCHEHTEHGSIRALRLTWRAPLRAGWAGQIPVLHLDATLRPELIGPYLPGMTLSDAVRARQPHVRVRQVIGAPTTAKALTPGDAALDRQQAAARNNLTDLGCYVALRAREFRRDAGAIDLLLIGQKKAIEKLRAAGLPPRVDAVHFNALSGLDRWGDVRCLVILGRTLPAPKTVQNLTIALTGARAIEETDDKSWWYAAQPARIRLANGKTHQVPADRHPDPTAEAIRWSICEAELIQAIGRGRGVNRNETSPLQIDLLTDIVLPVTVDELIAWNDLQPGRHEQMALAGVILENAADMAACFSELWPNRDAAKKDNQRRGTNCYYRTFYNSNLSPSSVRVTYQPEGAGQKTREAVFDLSLIPDPGAWLTERLGALRTYLTGDIESLRDSVDRPP